MLMVKVLHRKRRGRPPKKPRYGVPSHESFAPKKTADDRKTDVFEYSDGEAYIPPTKRYKTDSATKVS